MLRGYFLPSGSLYCCHRDWHSATTTEQRTDPRPPWHWFNSTDAKKIFYWKIRPFTNLKQDFSTIQIYFGDSLNYWLGTFSKFQQTFWLSPFPALPFGFYWIISTFLHLLHSLSLSSVTPIGCSANLGLERSISSPSSLASSCGRPVEVFSTRHLQFLRLLWQTIPVLWLTPTLARSKSQIGEMSPSYFSLRTGAENTRPWSFLHCLP